MALINNKEYGTSSEDNKMLASEKSLISMPFKPRKDIKSRQDDPIKPIEKPSNLTVQNDNNNEGSKHLKRNSSPVLSGINNPEVSTQLKRTSPSFLNNTEVMSHLKRNSISVMNDNNPEVVTHLKGNSTPVLNDNNPGVVTHLQRNSTPVLNEDLFSIVRDNFLKATEKTPSVETILNYLKSFEINLDNLMLLESNMNKIKIAAIYILGIYVLESFVRHKHILKEDGFEELLDKIIELFSLTNNEFHFKHGYSLPDGVWYLLMEFLASSSVSVCKSQRLLFVIVIDKIGILPSSTVNSLLFLQCLILQEEFLDFNFIPNNFKTVYAKSYYKCLKHFNDGLFFNDFYIDDSTFKICTNLQKQRWVVSNLQLARSILQYCLLVIENYPEGFGDNHILQLEYYAAFIIESFSEPVFHHIWFNRDFKDSICQIVFSITELTLKLHPYMFKLDGFYFDNIEIDAKKMMKILLSKCNKCYKIFYGDKSGSDTYSSIVCSKYYNAYDAIKCSLFELNVVICEQFYQLDKTEKLKIYIKDESGTMNIYPAN